MSYAIGEIAVLCVDRIEAYGACFKARSEDATSVLVLIPEIAWEPTRHRSLRLSLGEEREVLVLRRASATEYTGSLRRLEEENPYEELLAMSPGTELRGTVEASFGGYVFFSLDGHPHVDAHAPCAVGSSDSVGSSVRVRLLRVDTEDWRAECEIVAEGSSGSAVLGRDGGG